MNFLLPWRIQFALTLLVGLALGYLFQPSAAVPPPTTVLFVQVRVSKDSAPLFEQVIRVAEQPAIVTPPGDARIELLNAAGQTLYRQSFQPDFNFDDLPAPASARVFAFILPNLAGAASIQLVTPQGAARYDLP